MPFKCDFCSRLFKYKRSRDRHVKLHTGDKKYRCSYCEAAFSRSDHLKIHLRTHDNGKPFQCVTCNRGYNTAAALTSHMQNHKKQQRLQQEQQQQQQEQAQQQDHTQKEQQEQEQKSKQSTDSTDSTQSQQQDEPTLVQLPETSSSKSSSQSQMTVVTKNKMISIHIQNNLKTLSSSSSLSSSELPTVSTLSRTCHLCGQIMHSPSQLQKHRTKYHYNKEVIFQSWKSETISDNSRISLPSETPIIPTAINSKLVCIYCSDDFNTMDDLKIHVDEKHYSIINGEHQETFHHLRPLNNSPLANQTSVSPISEPNNMKLTCYLCSMQFLDVQTFQIHLFNVHRLVMNSCPYCAQHFENPEQMADHFFRAHQSNIFSEQIKPTDLSRKTKLPNFDMDNYAKRLKRSNGNAIHTESTSTPLSQTSSTSTPNQLEYNNVLLCSQCGAALPDFEAFRDHLKVHLEHVENIRNVLTANRMTDTNQLSPNFRRSLLKSSHVLVCPHCKQVFKESNHLEKHISTHFLATITEYNCKTCIKCFTTADQLQKHLFDTHTQQIFRCGLCKEIFDSRVAIQVHFAVKHNDENHMFRCIVCPSDSRPIFRTEKAGKIHVKTIHNNTTLPLQQSPTNGGRSFRCQFCLSEFNSDMEFQLHLTMHFQPYKCPICPKTFQVEYLLERHMQDYHQGNQIANGSNSEETFDHESNQRLSIPSDLAYPLLSTKSSMDLHDQTANCIKLETPDYKINTCDVCDRNDFANESELISHRKIVHHMKSTLKNGVVSLHCAYCNENCKSRTELENHMKNHSQSSGASGKHKCNICDELCPSAALLAEHKLTHCKVVAGNSCTRCKATLHTDEQFYTHLVQHSNSNNNNNASNNQINLPFPCVICRQTLISNIEVQMHAQFHVRNTSSMDMTEQQCILCFKPLEKTNIIANNQNSNNLLCKDCFTHPNYNLAIDLPKQDFQKHSDLLPNKKYSCIRCQLNFTSENEIQNHLTTHLMNEGSRHECHLCRNKFSSHLKLQIHLIEHTFAGIGSYTCYLCSAVFTAAQGLHSHMFEHGLVNRPYDCQKCDAGFFFRAELDNHSYVHLQDYIQAKELTNTYQTKLYQCAECPQNFSDLTIFLAHTRTVHQIKNGTENNQDSEINDESKQQISLSAPSDNEYIEIESPNPIKVSRE